MAISRTTLIDDDGSGTTGSILNNAWQQNFYNQIDGAIGGLWTDIPYSAANYTADAGTWMQAAGAQVTLAYTVVNKIAHVVIAIQNGANSGAAVRLGLTWPGVPAPSRWTYAPMSYFQGSGPGTGLVEIDPNTAKFNFLRDIAGSPWSVNASGLHLRAEWFYPII